MKKVVRIFLIMLLILGFNLNVYADEDQTFPSENEQGSEESTLKSFTIRDKKGLCTEDNVCSLTIEDDVKEVEITYELAPNAEIVNGSNKLTLKNGENRFIVTVKAENGTTKDYTIIINKKVTSTDNTLKKLTINGENIDLKNGVTKYNTTVSYAAKSITVEAIPNDSNATISDAKNNKLTYDFYDDTKEIRIKVIAPSSDVLTYVINVTRRSEEDTTLRSLKIENYDIDFEKNVTNYEITVLKNVDKLDITATPTDTSAVVKINQPDVLAVGENTITINVTNDGNTRDYIIKVTKLNEEDKSLANLSSLKIENYDLDFKEDKYEYDLKVGNVNSLNIDYKTKNPDATVQITGNMDLENGSIVKIRVTYTSGLTNVYRINIIKDEIAKKNNKASTMIIIIAIILIIITALAILIYQLKNKDKDKNNKKDNSKKGDSKKVLDSEVQDLDTKFQNIGVNPNDVINIDNQDDEIEDII